MQPMDGKVKVKLRKPVTAECGKMQAVTTLCRLQCGVAKLCVIVPVSCGSSWLFVELFVLKWSVRPRVGTFLLH